tara:strand:+ start:748 stop:1014 length:267 start_codon:yes stop_codon:yes gene_type:complete
MISEILLLGPLLLNGSTPPSNGKGWSRFARGGQSKVSTPKPVQEWSTESWSVLTGQGARDQTYTVNVTPAEVAVYKESERVKKALRSI